MEESKAKQDSREHLIALRAVGKQGASLAKVAQNLSGLGGQWVVDGDERNSSDCRSWVDIKPHPWEL